MPPPHITLKDLVPEQILDKDPPTPPVSDAEVFSPGPTTYGSPREKGELSQGVCLFVCKHFLVNNLVYARYTHSSSFYLYC